MKSTFEKKLEKEENLVETYDELDGKEIVIYSFELKEIDKALSETREQLEADIVAKYPETDIGVSTLIRKHFGGSK